eukprot:gnl/Hemi2/26534_TR8907_c0_g1_i1.p2 gnl/Hemi2/26534_TR8907_c0_g1~~gnl/Hemi2/26534_TR8907_c0_g1_i1.p2  ORF type:complete len:164 (-),score=66.45 gnl/Hemi2/26534_TR8907_c0_g1_i1:269-760(-)
MAKKQEEAELNAKIKQAEEEMKALVKSLVDKLEDSSQRLRKVRDDNVVKDQRIQVLEKKVKNLKKKLRVRDRELEGKQTGPADGSASTDEAEVRPTQLLEEYSPAALAQLSADFEAQFKQKEALLRQLNDQLLQLHRDMESDANRVDDLSNAYAQTTLRQQED